MTFWADFIVTSAITVAPTYKTYGNSSPIELESPFKHRIAIKQ